MVAVQVLHRRAALHLYGYKNRKTQAATPRQPVRVRKRCVQARTTQERSVATARRRANKKRVEDAIDASLNVVGDEAAKLHEVTGLYTPGKWLQTLLQKGGKRKRRLSLWQAWLRKRGREKKAGE